MAEETSAVSVATTMSAEQEVVTTRAEEADTTTEAWAEAVEEEATIEAAVIEEGTAPEAVEEATTMTAKIQWEEEADQEVDTSQVIVTETVNHKAQQQWSTGEHAVATAQTVLQRMGAIDELCANQNYHI